FELGSTYRRLGEFEQAQRYLEAALEAARRDADEGRQMLVLIQLGYTHYELGHGEQALATFQEALSLARATSSDAGRGHVLVGEAMARSSSSAMPRAWKRSSRPSRPMPGLAVSSTTP